MRQAIGNRPEGAEARGTVPEAGPDGTLVQVRLLSSDRILVQPDEIARLLVHRIMLVCYAGLSALLLLLDVGGHRAVVPVDLHVATAIVTVAAMVGTFLAYVRARLAAGVRDMHLTPALLLATIAGMTVSDALHRLLGVGSGWTPVQAVLLLVFYAALLELSSMAAAQTVIPVVLRDIRRPRPVVSVRLPVAGIEAAAGTKDGTGPVTGPVTGAATGPVTGVGAGAGARDEAVVLAGGRRLDASSILHLEACGNYVRLLTDRGRELVPGPFTTILSQMPDDLGRRVHRSHWVAERAVRGFRRNSRDMRVILTGGDEVPVAIPRQVGLLPWLAALGGRTG